MSACITLSGQIAHLGALMWKVNVLLFVYLAFNFAKISMLNMILTQGYTCSSTTCNVPEGHAECTQFVLHATSSSSLQSAARVLQLMASLCCPQCKREGS